MILEDLHDLEEFAIMKYMFIEPFKGGGGRWSSYRRKNKVGLMPYFPIFVFFIILYLLTFIFFNSARSLQRSK
jgi:hypothetical protein